MRKLFTTTLLIIGLLLIASPVLLSYADTIETEDFITSTAIEFEYLSSDIGNEGDVAKLNLISKISDTAIIELTVYFVPFYGTFEGFEKYSYEYDPVYDMLTIYDNGVIIYTDWD